MEAFLDKHPEFGGILEKYPKQLIDSMNPSQLEMLAELCSLFLEIQKQNRELAKVFEVSINMEKKYAELINTCINRPQ